MPNISFYLNTSSKGKKGTSPIMAKVIYNKKRYYKSIARVNTNDWDDEKQRIKSSYKQYKAKNATIQHLKSLMLTFDNYCQLNKYPDIEKAIKMILSGIDPIQGKRSPNIPEIKVLDAFSEFVEYSKNNSENNTYRRRNTVYNFVQDFSEKTNYNITFQNIDVQLFDKMKEYSAKKKHSNNTFAQTVKVFKRFLSWSQERNYFNGSIPKYKATEKDITPIILTIDEFKTLYDFEFTDKKLARVRDIFCFGCLTGLRFSDLQRARRDWIVDDQLVITMKKVKEPVRIPLVDRSRKIVEKYKEQPVWILPRISNQKFNDYIKKACEAAEIKSPVTISTHSGNKFTEKTYPKHKVITAHVSRKTFISMSLYLGMTQKVVQEITGIREEKTLRKYISIVDEMKTKEMNNTWGKV